MKLKEYKKELLETMGYDDIAIIILEESGKKMKIADLFKEICKVLSLSDADYENQIADFFELLSTNKNFIMLENGFWDLRTKHTPKIVIDEEDDEIIDTNEEEIIDEKEEEDIFYDADGDDEDEDDDDLKDLVIVDEDEEEANTI